MQEVFCRVFSGHRWKKTLKLLCSQVFFSASVAETTKCPLINVMMGSGGDKVPWGRSVGWLDFDDRVQEKLQEAEEFTGNYVGAGMGFLGGRR